jgi:hypothetical protein
MVTIKKDVFGDMGSKLKDWKHSLKNKLKIRNDDISKTVRTRMTAMTLWTCKCCWINGVRRRIR